MPIVRTYACEQCNHFLEVTLTAEQWDAPAPDCPRCIRQWGSGPEMAQEFKPPAITGSAIARASELAQRIAAEDYGVADMQMNRGDGATPSVRYKDETANLPRTNWEANREVLEGAIAVGRESRLRHGSGLDVLQAGLKSGAQPDLIELSKRRSIRVG